jgi:hypothetical protein
MVARNGDNIAPVDLSGSTNNEHVAVALEVVTRSLGATAGLTRWGRVQRQPRFRVSVASAF